MHTDDVWNRSSPAIALSRLDFPHPECPITSSDCPFTISMLRSYTSPHPGLHTAKSPETATKIRIRVTQHMPGTQTGDVLDSSAPGTAAGCHQACSHTAPQVSGWLRRLSHAVCWALGPLSASQLHRKNPQLSIVNQGSLRTTESNSIQCHGGLPFPVERAKEICSWTDALTPNSSEFSIRSFMLNGYVPASRASNRSAWAAKPLSSFR